MGSVEDARAVYRSLQPYLVDPSVEFEAFSAAVAAACRSPDEVFRSWDEADLSERRRTYSQAPETRGRRNARVLERPSHARRASSGPPAFAADLFSAGGVGPGATETTRSGRPEGTADHDQVSGAASHRPRRRYLRRAGIGGQIEAKKARIDAAVRWHSNIATAPPEKKVRRPSAGNLGKRLQTARLA